MTITKQSIERGRVFLEKIRKFNEFKKLGNELFEGGEDYYDEPWGLVVPYNYEWEVETFVDGLKRHEKVGLRSYNPEFYKSFMHFYYQIKMKKEHKEEEVNLNIIDYA